MSPKSYYYNCSPEYIQTIDLGLYDQIITAVSRVPKRQTQSEINADLFWLFTSEGWMYDTVPVGAATSSSVVRDGTQPIDAIKMGNNRNLCLTSTTLDTRWHADYAKSYGSNLVQIEAQFGKVEAMFKDFCGFRIAFAERRLALGVEIVITNPPAYFAHRRNAVSGMASFDIAKNTLTSIGLDCPIWLIGFGA